MLEKVDLRVALDHLMTDLAIAAHECLHGGLHLRLRQVAHAVNCLVELLQLLVIGVDGMLQRVFLGHRTFPVIGVRSDQPKRPVMYCCVFSLAGLVKICSVTPYSTSSPRYMKAV